MKRDPLLPLRAKIDAEKNGGARHWRSIEHKAGDVDFDNEFPSGVEPLSAVQRRDVLKLAGATFALAGASACIRRPEEEILPYTHQPEHVIPGIPNTFATAMPRSEGGLGLVATAFEGRPTKLDGNELHPSSLGASESSLVRSSSNATRTRRCWLMEPNMRSASSGWRRTRAAERSGNR